MTTTPVLSLPAAEALAERLRAAIVADRTVASSEAMAGYFIDRVAADVAGLEEHNDRDWGYHPSCAIPCPDARRYSDSLLATAALYGCT